MCGEWVREWECWRVHARHLRYESVAEALALSVWIVAKPKLAGPIWECSIALQLYAREKF